MLNIEMYKNLLDRTTFGIAVTDGIAHRCCETNCSDCDFYGCEEGCDTLVGMKMKQDFILMYYLKMESLKKSMFMIIKIVWRLLETSLIIKSY